MARVAALHAVTWKSGASAPRGRLQKENGLQPRWTVSPGYDQPTREALNFSRAASLQ